MKLDAKSIYETHRELGDVSTLDHRWTIRAYRPANGGRPITRYFSGAERAGRTFDAGRIFLASINRLFKRWPYDMSNTQVTLSPQNGQIAMSARKYREVAAHKPEKTVIRVQPPYQSEISDDYLAALQGQVDAGKPDGFKLTPISEPGW